MNTWSETIIYSQKSLVPHSTRLQNRLFEGLLNGEPQAKASSIWVLFLDLACLTWSEKKPIPRLIKQLGISPQLSESLTIVPMDHASNTLPILDIRREKLKLSLQNEIREMVDVKERECMQVPWELFWDAKGLQIFEEMTYLDDYYPTNTELSILQDSADQLACSFQEGAIIVELGSGYVHHIRLSTFVVSTLRPRN